MVESQAGCTATELLGPVYCSGVDHDHLALP